MEYKINIHWLQEPIVTGPIVKNKIFPECPVIKRDYKFLDRFLDKIKKDIGNTGTDGYSEHIIKASLERLSEEFGLNKNSNLIDIGSGDGRFKNIFDEFVDNYTSISLVKEDDKTLIYDQSFLPEEFTGKFDFVYARHILEHSVLPYFTLTEYNRILKDKGIVYLEVPVITEKRQNCYLFGDNDELLALNPHEKNHNHYSVFNETMLEELILRSKFDVLSKTRINIYFNYCFIEIYYCYFLRKVENW